MARHAYEPLLYSEDLTYAKMVSPSRERKVLVLPRQGRMKEAP